MEIRVNGLRKRFGPAVALHDFSFQTGSDWKCLGVLGRNGAGKTTFLRILVGLLCADGGEIEIEVASQTWDRAGPNLATFVAENTVLINSITGVQYLRLYGAMNRLGGVDIDRSQLDDLLERFALQGELHKKIGRMSKGTRRKLQVAAAIASTVPLVVADELTEGLDVPSRLKLESCIRDLAAAGQHFVISSHDLSFILSISDAVIVVDRGRCVDQFLVPDDEASFKTRVAAAFDSLPASRPEGPDAEHGSDAALVVAHSAARE